LTDTVSFAKLPKFEIEKGLKLMWTHFHDMHSGGCQKLQWAHIFVEADEDEAKEFFEEAFNRDPEHTTCNCCGGDYSISTEDSLEQITGYERSAAYAYIEKATGREVSKDEAWERGKGFKEGIESRYVERQRFYDHKPELADGTYQTLEEFKLRPDILIVRRTKELGNAYPLKQLTEGVGG
jgi:hypothetical protein